MEGRAAGRLGSYGRSYLCPIDFVPPRVRAGARAHSSAGRASGWQPEGQGFESPWVHFTQVKGWEEQARGSLNLCS
jgi:hypothetical protein